MDPLDRIRLELNDALELLEEEDCETAAEHIRSVLDILDGIMIPSLGEPLDFERCVTYDRDDEDEDYVEDSEEPRYWMKWDN
jgi:hypothetical protein